MLNAKRQTQRRSHSSKTGNKNWSLRCQRAVSSDATFRSTESSPTFRFVRPDSGSEFIITMLNIFKGCSWSVSLITSRGPRSNSMHGTYIPYNLIYHRNRICIISLWYVQPDVCRAFCVSSILCMVVLAPCRPLFMFFFCCNPVCRCATFGVTAACQCQFIDNKVLLLYSGAMKGSGRLSETIQCSNIHVIVRTHT